MISGLDRPLSVEYAESVLPVLQSSARYKVLYGGRGGVKSWSFAKHAIVRAAYHPVRVLCCREVQTSIKDSVHKLLSEKIVEMGVSDMFSITEKSIKGLVGSEFIFKGLRHNLSEIKSTEGIDICWIEEAEPVSSDSWEVLIPTIRKENSEIWISFNPEDENSSTYQRFVINPPKNCVSKLLTFQNNPWFPDVLREEMEHCREHDPEKFEWVWMGRPRKFGQSVIFKDKVRIEEFEPPDSTIQLYYGADWGFGPSPTCLIRMFVRDRTLFIENEFYSFKAELDDLESGFDTVPGSRDWLITADSSRPDTIEFMRRRGFMVEGAKKGKDSIKEGIEFLRNFDAIVIHPRCRGAIDDFKSYRWKTDPVTGIILPIPIDKSNHACDSARYALEPYQRAGVTIYDVIQ